MFTKSFIGRGGGNFHGRKLTPKNASQENWLRKFAPHPPKKKKRKKRKLTPENIIF